MILNNRYDFTVFFEVKNGNPNGDPDFGNMPRTDILSGKGIVTDVCAKRKIRNYVSVAKEGEEGYLIYVQDGVALEQQQLKAYESLGVKPSGTAKHKDKDKELTQYMCDNYYDIRTFGAVMTTSANCGQVRGPVQLGFAESVDEITPAEVTITRCTVTSVKELDKGQMMGKKHIVPYGLYRLDGYVSANLAQKTGFTEEDLELLWEALINMFDVDRAAARGHMATRKLFVFKHDSKLGNAPAHVLFDKISANKKVETPRCFNDYEITVETSMPSGVELIEKL